MNLIKVVAVALFIWFIYKMLFMIADAFKLKAYLIVIVRSVFIPSNIWKIKNFKY